MRTSLGILAVLTLSTGWSSAGIGQTTAPPAGRGGTWTSPKQAGRPALKTRPSGDAAIVRTVADAMGFVRGLGRGETTDTLNRLQWFGAGTMTENGRRYVVTKYSYAMSLSLNGAREDLQRRPMVGGATERLVYAYLGADAWNETTPGVGATPAPDPTKLRRLQFLRTPFGFTKALLQLQPGTATITDPGPGQRITIAAMLEGVPFLATLDPDYRPASIVIDVDGHTIGTTYAQYRDLHEYGVMFPTRIADTVDGRPTRTLAIDDGRVASYLILQPPSRSGS